MRYRKDNAYKKAWDRATKEQRQEFRDALQACLETAERHSREILPLADRLERACADMWGSDRPVEMDCADTEMRFSPLNQLRRAVFEVVDYLGPEWDFEVGAIHMEK